MSESLNPVLKFLFRISKEINLDELESMKFIADLPEGVNAELVTPLKFMRELRKREKITDRPLNLDLLEEIFHEINRLDLKAKVVEFVSSQRAAAEPFIQDSSFTDLQLSPTRQQVPASPQSEDGRSAVHRSVSESRVSTGQRRDADFSPQPSELSREPFAGPGRTQSDHQLDEFRHHLRQARDWRPDDQSESNVHETIERQQSTPDIRPILSSEHSPPVFANVSTEHPPPINSEQSTCSTNSEIAPLPALETSVKTVDDENTFDFRESPSFPMIGGADAANTTSSLCTMLQPNSNQRSASSEPHSNRSSDPDDVLAPPCGSSFLIPDMRGDNSLDCDGENENCTAPMAAEDSVSESDQVLSRRVQSERVNEQKLCPVSSTGVLTTGLECDGNQYPAKPYGQSTYGQSAQSSPFSSSPTHVVTDTSSGAKQVLGSYSALRAGIKSSTSAVRRKRNITLWKYQEELAKPGIAGKNCIICAPTGSGKTMTAGHVCRVLMAKARSEGRPFKALFIVCIRNLVQQQTEALREIVPDEDTVVGIGENMLLPVYLQRHDVVVLTAQILVNALKAKELKMSSIDLLIMDECHHTDQNHPYNAIMQIYHADCRSSPKVRLPQIIGLTASLGVGSSCDDPLPHYIKLCANLDCMSITHVRDKAHMEELLQHNPRPKKDQIIAVDARPSDSPFIQIITLIMSEIEKTTNFLLSLTSKGTAGTQPYENWAVQQKIAAEEKDDRNAIAGAEALQKFNTALMVYDELRAKDAKKLLDEYFSGAYLAERPTVSSEQIHSLYLENRKELQHIVDTERLEDNSKLDKLCTLLSDMYSSNNDVRGRHEQC